MFNVVHIHTHNLCLYTRYLAREFGLNGANNVSNAQVFFSSNLSNPSLVHHWQKHLWIKITMNGFYIFSNLLSMFNHQAEEIVDVINDLQQAIVSSFSKCFFFFQSFPPLRCFCSTRLCSWKIRPRRRRRWKRWWATLCLRGFSGHL